MSLRQHQGRRHRARDRGGDRLGGARSGTVLRQEQLSEQFNVSRTPVREALRRLAALGLVSFVPNRGVRVRTLSRDELQEAFMVRAELEGLATEVAATKFTAEAVEELEAAERSFAAISQELRAGEPGDDRRSIMGDWVRGNHAFHDVIYRVAALPLVEQLAKSARRTFSGRRCGRGGGRSIDDLPTRRTRRSTARSSTRSRRAAPPAPASSRASRAPVGRVHLLETILEQVGARPRDWRGRPSRPPRARSGSRIKMEHFYRARRRRGGLAAHLGRGGPLPR